MASHPQREWHPAFEEYCEAIFELREDDVAVKQARIVERLDVSRAAVSEMVRRMADEQRRGAITLLPDTSGESLAQAVVRRHRLAERFLTDILGLSWADAHVEAGRWEHVISPTVETALQRVLGEPTTCPHGNPIPGTDYLDPDAVALDTLAVGATFVVRRIPEELEFTPGMLDFLEASSLLPGHTGTVTESDGSGRTVVVVDGRPIEIDDFTTARILVTAS